MATISNFNGLPLKTFYISVQNSNFSSKSSLSPVNLISVSDKIMPQNSSLKKEFTKPKQKFSVRAVIDDEWGPEKEPDASAITEAKEEPQPTEIDILKKQLVDSFYGTNRGLTASSETRAQIVELITQLEAKNPNPAPTEALTRLNGKWILVYTSFVGLFPWLSRGTLPLVTLEEISQTIDSENFTVHNSVVFAGPLATTSISSNAKFEVRSPQRLQIKVEEGIIRTPQLTDSIVLPENVEVLGQKIDLTPLKGLLSSVQDTASSVAKTISSQPPLKIPIPSSRAESWLLTTYLDDDLRISRGDGGSVFVLIKEGSALLTP